MPQRVSIMDKDQQLGNTHPESFSSWFLETFPNTPQEDLPTQNQCRNEEDAFVIQARMFGIWVTRDVEFEEINAWRRAGHLLQFDFDEVRVITPQGLIITDSDQVNEL